MGDLAEFGINILGLENKQYVFQFPVNDRFFSNFENSEISKGKLECRITLDKNSSLIRVNINISGWVELICDRSLDPFKYTLDTGGQVIYKFGDEEKEIDDDVILITRNHQTINLAQSIYEFITIAVPMKKLHPRFDLETEPDDELIYTTGDLENETENDSSETDPRWEALKKLKNKKEE